MPARKGENILGEGTAPDLSPYAETTVAAVSVVSSTGRDRFRSKPRSVLASLILLLVFSPVSSSKIPFDIASGSFWKRECSRCRYCGSDRLCLVRVGRWAADSSGLWQGAGRLMLQAAVRRDGSAAAVQAEEEEGGSGCWCGILGRACPKSVVEFAVGMYPGQGSSSPANSLIFCCCCFVAPRAASHFFLCRHRLPATSPPRRPSSSAAAVVADGCLGLVVCCCGCLRVVAAGAAVVCVDFSGNLVGKAKRVVGRWSEPESDEKELRLCQSRSQSGLRRWCWKGFRPGVE